MFDWTSRFWPSADWTGVGPAGPDASPAPRVSCLAAGRDIVGHRFLSLGLLFRGFRTGVALLVPPFIGRVAGRDRRVALSLARIFRLGLYVMDFLAGSAMVLPVAGLWIFLAG